MSLWAIFRLLVIPCFSCACVCVCVAGHGLENMRGDKVRIFRAEKSYAITQGKWYFEFEAVTTGEMRVGWARPSVHADTELGADELAYVFNGNKVSHPPSLPPCF